MRSLRVQESIEIDRGVEEVFEVITDPHSWTRFEGGARFEVLTPLHEGSLVGVEVDIKGETHHGQAEVVAFEPPHSFGMRGEGEPVNGTALARLDGDRGRTLLTVSVELEPSRWIYGLSFAVGGRWLRSRFAQVVRAKLVELKVTLEAGG